MAHLIPINNTAFITSGERRFYAFLRDAVKPDSHCLAWYSPSVDGLEPDFVLYTPEEGLIVFEVKDWVLSQIRAADPHTVTIALADGREECRKNPVQQAREYVFALMNRIKTSCKRLLSTEPRYRGKSRVPVQYGLVFPNISRSEFTASQLKAVLPPEKTFFSDDLLSAAAHSDDQGASRLRKQLGAMFPPPYAFRLTSDDVAALREVLWPQVRIALPKRAGRSPKDEYAGSDELTLLDAQQESLARRLDAEQAVIEGPAGSGKTLVLMAKAVETHERLRRTGCDLPVLVVCFNLTLVHYLKRLLAGYKASIGRTDIQVTHFYEFCRSLLREPLKYEKEDATYYELVTRLALEATVEAPAYGAIFVDEGQDFSDDMLAILRKRLATDGMFWIALDAAQGLYDIPRTWLEETKLQRFNLRSPYRATRKLMEFGESLVSHKMQNSPGNEAGPPPFAVNSLEGEAPRLHWISCLGEGAGYIVERIRELHDHGVPYSEIMILYVSRQYEGLDEDLPLFLQETLEGHGILSSWPARDAQSKAGWDITTDSVTISTIHSMKGMDAEAVFIIGLDDLKPSLMPAVNNLAYVSCTRARRFLDILYLKETPLIQAMLQSVSTLIQPLGI